MEHSHRKPERITALSRRPEIYAFVVDFYSEIRAHETLGPVFNAKIEHWDNHFETLTDFWMTVLLGVPAYKGNPFQAHQKVSGITAGLFDSWLLVFAACAKRMLAGDLAEIAILKSKRIADSLRQGLLFSTDTEPLAKNAL
jgi:hemoglobin